MLALKDRKRPHMIFCERSTGNKPSPDDSEHTPEIVGLILANVLNNIPLRVGSEFMVGWTFAYSSDNGTIRKIACSSGIIAGQLPGDVAGRDLFFSFVGDTARY